VPKENIMIPINSPIGGTQMSILRAVDVLLKEKTNIYSPLIEAIVNSIDAIKETNRLDGKIIITPERNQLSLDLDVLPEIVGFTIEDNGTGFNDENKKSFSDMCSEYKMLSGGKGIGRLTYLKYFNDVRVKSIFRHNGEYYQRDFKLGNNNDFIENEQLNKSTASDLKTVLILKGLKQQSFDKELDTIARKILEKILIFFVNDESKCPEIILEENNKPIILNNYLQNSDEIKELKNDTFTLDKNIGETKITENFRIKIFKITYPRNISSKLCLTAHNRYVTETGIHKYIPEFGEDFVDQIEEITKKYIIVAYILGEYLNQNVSLERGRFEFPTEQGDMAHPFSQQDIEKSASQIINKLFDKLIKDRREETRRIIQDCVDKKFPWYKTYISELKLEELPYKPDEPTIENALHKISIEKESYARATVDKVIHDPKMEITEKVNEAIKHIQQAGINSLVHHVVLRKTVLDVLAQKLKNKADGRPSLEADIHNLIYPMKADSEMTDYENNNLWILDEKLNFTELILSDKYIDKEKNNRPDLMVAHKLYDKIMAYRGGEEAGNPITIFEFKQPLRDDFTDISAKDDPIRQIIRYTIKLKEGNCITPQGRPIRVNNNTNIYGFVICDFNNKVENWLVKDNNFIPMPDKQGYYYWHGGNNLYIEVLSWDKVVKDAEMRNKIFFKKLGLVI
jgi:hypothetical protein